MADEPKLEDQLDTSTRIQEWTMDFYEILWRQIDFSFRTFGPGTRHQALLDHIQKELKEVDEAHAWDSEAELNEWIDVVILALDAAWRLGFPPYKIIQALQAKQRKNEERVWPDWRTSKPDEAIQHVKDMPGLSILEFEIGRKAKEWIDSQDYEGLLRRWRFSHAGDPMFQGDIGDYYKTQMLKLKDQIGPEAAVQASKNVGWEGPISKERDEDE